MNLTRRISGLGDPLLLGVIILVSGLGIAMIYSAGQVEVRSVATGIWVRQLTWLGVAAIAFVVMSRMSLRFLEWLAPWLYGVSLALLLLVLGIGTGPSGSWIELGPGRLQPGTTFLYQ